MLNDWRFHIRFSAKNASKTLDFPPLISKCAIFRHCMLSIAPGKLPARECGMPIAPVGSSSPGTVADYLDKRLSLGTHRHSFRQETCRPGQHRHPLQQETCVGYLSDDILATGSSMPYRAFRSCSSTSLRAAMAHSSIPSSAVRVVSFCIIRPGHRAIFTKGLSGCEPAHLTVTS